MPPLNPFPLTYRMEVTLRHLLAGGDCYGLLHSCYALVRRGLARYRRDGPPGRAYVLTVAGELVARQLADAAGRPSAPQAR